MTTPDKPQLLIIAAAARSGTTVLKNMLSQSHVIHNFGEVFHTWNRDEPHNFFNFQRSPAESGTPFELMGWDDKAKLFSRYARKLESLTAKPVHLLDIKYASWHHLNPLYYGFSNPPLLVKILAEHHAAIVHVVRHDVLAQVLSEELAFGRGVWHSVDPGASEPFEKIVPRPDTIVDRVRQNITEATLMRSFFETYDRYTELCFEETIVDNQLSENARSSIGAVLGRDIGGPFQTAFRKVSPPIEHYVGNLDAILEALERSGLSHVIRMHQSYG